MTETEKHTPFEEPGGPQEQPESDPSTAPAPPEEGPGPPGNPPADDEAVERGEDELDQVTGR